MNSFIVFILVSSDTDLDGYPDGNEVAYGLNPKQSLSEVAGTQAENELDKVGVEIPREEIKQYVEGELETNRQPYVRQWNKNQLQTTDDHSEDSIYQYAESVKQALAHLSSVTNDELLASHFENAAVWQIDSFIHQQQNTLDQLLTLTVPSQFMGYHIALMNINEGFLGMAVAAKEWTVEKGIPMSGWLYPEIQHIANQEQVYTEHQIAIEEKFGITL